MSKERKDMSQAKKDINASKHGMYLAMEEAGLLVNGRFKVGSRIPDKKKKTSRHACRGKLKDY